MEVFGLLHLAPSETSAMNASTSSFDDQIRMYWRNASLLARSLRVQGIGFTLLTNSAAGLAAIVGEPTSFAVVGIDCSTDVPRGLPFYSAHFKVDAYRHLGSLQSDYIVFSDLDAVCMNPPPPSVARAFSGSAPLVYEVSDQLRPAVGADGLIHDVDTVAGRRTEGRWLGGEFVAGPPRFFADLTRSIEAVLPAYFANTATLHNLNDESYLSAAVASMRQDGYVIGDAGPIAAVGRFWSVEVKHVQHHLDYFRDHFLLHLPVDKQYLATIDAADAGTFDPQRFWDAYQQHVQQRMAGPGPRTVRSVMRGIARCARAAARATQATRPDADR